MVNPPDDKNIISLDEKQFNSITCFKKLAKKGYPSSVCTALQTVAQVGCLTEFARVNNDLSICEEARTWSISEDCIRNAIQSKDDCRQLKDKERINDCMENMP